MYDDKQAEAQYKMLMHKCSSVQGPPGTGKTMMALLNSLLTSQSQKTAGFRGVLFVVCSTDQGLDDVIAKATEESLFRDHILRTGQQSRASELMEPYS